MGWLGWSEREAMEADVNAIEIAMEGKMEMIKFAFFGKNPFEKKPSVDARWRDFAKTHNAFMRSRGHK